MSWFLEWIENNLPAITGFMTSGTFLTLIAFLWNLIKNNKMLKNNNKNSELLNENITVVNNTKDSIDATNATVKELNERVALMNRQFVAVIDILSLVYSRSKDEDVRNAVSAIVTTLRYSDNDIILQLRNELNELKKSIPQETIDDVKHEIDKGVQVVESVVEISRG